MQEGTRSRCVCVLQAAFEEEEKEKEKIEGEGEALASLKDDAVPCRRSFRFSFRRRPTVWVRSCPPKTQNRYGRVYIIFPFTCIEKSIARGERDAPLPPDKRVHRVVHVAVHGDVGRHPVGEPVDLRVQDLPGEGGHPTIGGSDGPLPVFFNMLMITRSWSMGKTNHARACTWSSPRDQSCPSRRGCTRS